MDQIQSSRLRFSQNRSIDQSTLINIIDRTLVFYQKSIIDRSPKIINSVNLSSPESHLSDISRYRFQVVNVTGGKRIGCAQQRRCVTRRNMFLATNRMCCPVQLLVSHWCNGQHNYLSSSRSGFESRVRAKPIPPPSDRQDRIVR